MTSSNTDFDKVMEELIQLRSEVAHQKEVQKQKESFDVVMKQMLAQRDTEREKQQEELRQERLLLARLRLLEALLHLSTHLRLVRCRALVAPVPIGRVLLDRIGGIGDASARDQRFFYGDVRAFLGQLDRLRRGHAARHEWLFACCAGFGTVKPRPGVNAMTPRVQSRPIGQ